MPSPTTPSDTCPSTRPGDPDAAVPARTPPRADRSPGRPLLRTAFRSFSGTATVIVGAAGDESRPQRRYLVHKELLTRTSPFFAAALDSTFAEGMDQVVRLPEEAPETFEWFLQWLYTGTLTTTHAPRIDAAPPRRGGPGASSAASGMFESRVDGELRNAAGSPKYFLLLELYGLSDRLLTPALSNHVLSTVARLSEGTNSVPTPNDTWILYDSIRDSSALRSLVLDLFAYKKTDKLLESHRDEWHPRFLRELVVKLKRPGPEAIDRHALVAWTPPTWSASKPCERCRELLPPGVSADKCAECDKAFCARCWRRYTPDAAPMPCDVSGCKPWMGRGMCARYHEHGEGEACG